MRRKRSASSRLPSQHEEVPQGCLISCWWQPEFTHANTLGPLRAEINVTAPIQCKSREALELQRRGFVLDEGMNGSLWHRDGDAAVPPPKNNHWFIITRWAMLRPSKCSRRRPVPHLKFDQAAWKRAKGHRVGDQPPQNMLLFVCFSFVNCRDPSKSSSLAWFVCTVGKPRTVCCIHLSHPVFVVTSEVRLAQFL